MPKTLILYDTRTGNTDRMARAVAEGAKSVDGVEVVLKRVAEGGGELADADGIILGSPTHNAKPSRTMTGFLSNLSEVPLKGRVGGAFGSYGWSGEAPEIIAQALRGQGVRVIGEAVRAKRSPGANDLTRCKDLGRTVAESVATIGEQTA